MEYIIINDRKYLVEREVYDYINKLRSDNLETRYLFNDIMYKCNELSMAIKHEAT